MPLPEEIVENVAALDGGPEWLAGLPADLDRVLTEWELVPGRPYTGGSCAWVAPVTCPDGSRAVLKAGFPHREAAGEAAALRHWGGGGAVRLLRSSADGFTLLLEPCEPGSALRVSDLAPTDRLAEGLHALAGLHAQGPPPATARIDPLAAVLAEWSEAVLERSRRLPADPGLGRIAAGLLASLPASATRTVLLHGDCNTGNLLRSHRAPWLAIDPKPVTGDPAYDLWPLMREAAPPLGEDQPLPALRFHLACSSDLLGEAPDRLAAWCFARAVESALDRMDTGFTEDARKELADARLLAEVVGL